jgi:DNA-binding response OmpR family regulator
MKLKILVIDDSEDDTFFFKRMLSQSGVSAVIHSASDGDTGLCKISEETFDCIFLDYNMPEMDGLHVLNNIRKIDMNTPVIMLTGQKDEKMIVKLMLEGASDYISKNALTEETLRLSVENALRVFHIKKEKQIAEAALKQSEARLAEAQRIAHIGNWEYDYDTKILFLSEEAQRILGNTKDNLYPSPLDFSGHVHPGDMGTVLEYVDSFKNNTSQEITIRYYSFDDSIKHLNIKCHICKREDGAIDTIVGTIQDITLLKNALVATQKATVKSKATSIVMSVAVFLFLISEAILDPIIDSITASLLISLSCKGGIAVALKPMEYFLERIMLSKIVFH